jgi:hypothetical protein
MRESDWSSDVCSSDLLVVDGIETKSRVAFYNFGDEGQEKEDQLIGGFDFKDTVIPKVGYMGGSRVCAVGDNKIIIFKAGKNPGKRKTITLEDSIKSVAMSESHLVVITENQKNAEEDKYTARIYSKSGREIQSVGFSSEYNRLVLGEKEFIVYGNYHCSIFNFAGHEYV